MLRAAGLGHRFGDRLLYQGLDLEILPGQCWALLGLNGCGKTTLLHSLAGLLRPSAGRVWLSGAELQSLGRQEIARRLAILPQRQSDAFPLSLLETVQSGGHPRAGGWGWPDAAERDQALALLRRFGLFEQRQRMSDTLSGGERRRLAVAQLLMQDSPIALLDEPDSHLDPCQRAAIVALLADHFSQPGRACLMSLHDPNLARRHCSHALLLAGDGGWSAGTCAQLLSPERLEALYGCPVTVLEGPNGPWYCIGY